MLLGDLKAAVRGLLHSKLYSVISLVGLACATTCAILVLARAVDENRYATYYEDGHEIYRVILRKVTDGGVAVDDWVPGGIAQGLRESYPDLVVSRASTTNGTKKWVRAEGNSQEMFFARVDSQFFDIFDLQVIRGRFSQEPFTAVLTESAARRLFGELDPIGRIVTRPGAGVDDIGDYRVSGLISDQPKYALHRLDVVATWPTSHRGAGAQRTWEGWAEHLFGPKCYLRIGASDPERIETTVLDLLRQNLEERFTKGVTFHLQPISRAHAFGLSEFGGPGESPAEYLAFLTLIAIVVVLVACVNFVCLAIARATTRQDEFRTRRAIGAGRMAIFRQLLAEFACLSAAAIAVGIALALCSPFSTIFGEPIPLSMLSNPLMALGIGAIWVSISLLSGIYPAILAARVSPAVRSQRSMAPKTISVRNALVVAQLATTAFFMVSAHVVHGQTQMMRTADLGYDPSQLYTTRGVLYTSKYRSSVRDALRRIPGVISATSMWPGPGAPEEPRSQVHLVDEPTNRHDMRIQGIDPYFLETYELELLVGQNVGPKEDGPEEGRFLLNETAVENLGFRRPSDALGREIVVGERRGPIVGIVQDFHSRSLHGSIEPMVLHSWARIAITIRVASGDLSSTLAEARKSWEGIVGEPVTFRAVDSLYEFRYRDQVRRSDTFGFMSLASIVLAALGVFGVASYETERRSREVGVRKVLGAAVTDIIALFWRQYVFFVVVAVLIALPLSFTTSKNWLEAFAYRIDLTVWPFALSVILTAGLFLVVVASQAIRVGRIDPAETLRRDS